MEAVTGGQFRVSLISGWLAMFLSKTVCHPGYGHAEILKIAVNRSMFSGCPAQRARQN